MPLNRLFLSELLITVFLILGFSPQTANAAAPVITSSPITVGYSGELYEYSVQASDADGDPLTYSRLEGPKQMKVVGNTFRWSIGKNKTGTFPVTVGVSDGATTVEQSYVITVTQFVNTPPVITSQPITSANSGEFYQYDVQATDTDGDTLSYSLSVAPSGMTISGSSISWTPDNAQVGGHAVTVVVSDGADTAEQAYTLTVSAPANQPPVITSQPILTASENTNYTYTAVASDPDGDTLSYSLTTAPVGMGLAGNTLSWMPDYDQSGLHNVTLSVSDGMDAVEQSFTITVSNANRAPQITSQPPLLAAVNQLYQYPIQANDLDGDALTFSISSAPAGMSMIGNVLNWTPTSTDVGSHDVTIVADDGEDSVNQSFTLVVQTNPVASLAITSQPITTAIAGQPYQYNMAVTNPAGGSVSYTLLDGSFGMSLDQNIFTWQSEYVEVGRHPLVLRVSNGVDSVEQSFVITVEAPNREPDVTAFPKTTAIVGQPYQYTVQASDADGDVLSYSLSMAPAGMTIAGSTVDWVPSSVQTGRHDVTVIVADDETSVEQNLIVLVGNPGEPIITSDPIQVGVRDNLYEYEIQAVDHEGDTLTYSLVEGPRKMTMVGNTVSWSVGKSKNGVYPVTVAVSDGVNTVQQSYDLTVSPLSDLPPVTITSVPGERTFVFQTYTYVIEVDNPLGGPLAYTIEEVRDDLNGVSISGNVFTFYPTQEFTFGNSGYFDFTIGVTDQYGRMTTQSWSVLHSRSTLIPRILGIAPREAIVGQPYQYTVDGRVDHPNVDPTFRLKSGPDGMTMTGDTAHWIPASDQLGMHTIVVEVGNDDNNVDKAEKASVTFVSLQVNEWPVISSSPFANASIDQPYQYTVVASDPDGDTLTYILSDGPEGLTLSDNTIYWTPTAADIGQHWVTIAVSDGKVVSWQDFLLQVHDYNEPPVFSVPPATTTFAEQQYQYAFSLSDPDGPNAASASLKSGPEGMYQSGQAIYWTPTVDQVGSHPVTLVATDGLNSVEYDYNITVEIFVPNNAPVITSAGPTSATAKVPYQYTVEATDADGDTLSYSLSAAPAGMTIVGNVISWIPTVSQEGSHQVTVEVSDGEAVTQEDYSVAVTVIEHAMTVCPVVPVADDGGFVDRYPDDNIAWVGSNYTDVSEIEKAFNNARLIDSSVTQYLIMPSQSEWDAMSVQEQGLYLVNSERQARGIKPYEGITPDVVTIAQDYSDYIRTNNQVIGHYNDGLSPLERLNTSPDIQANSDFNSKPESVFSHTAAGPTPTDSDMVVRAVYYWVYFDKFPLSGSAWGHRDQLLLNDFNENSNGPHKEGLAGFGISTGAYDPSLSGQGLVGGVVVFNTFDQSSGWDHGDTTVVDVDGAQACNNHIEIIVDESGVSNPSQLVELKLSPSDILMAKNGTAVLQLTGVYLDSSEVDLTSIAHFISDSRSVVEVSGGTITALTVGSAYIKATVGTLSSNSIWVNVDKPTDLSNLSGTYAEDYLEYVPTNVTVDSYDPKAFSLFTGLVTNRYGVPLSGVTVSYLNKPEYGSVETDLEGRFVIAAEAGPQTLIYRKENYLTVHRSKPAASSSWAAVEDVVMLEADSKQTAINLANPAPQTHVSTPVTDAWGTRATTLVFDGINTATITSPDGSQRQVTDFSVRATEYELPESMPAPLPDTSAFTYCSELDIPGVRDDEVVTFDNPVVMYVDNFLGFGVGEIIPIGYYDRLDGEWKGSQNGVVVTLLDTSNDGLVDGVDYNGDGVADDINNNGSTTDEAAGIENFEIGKTYWRGSFNHFTPWDYNLGSQSDRDSQDQTDPESSANEEDEKNDELDCTGSYVKPYQQSFHEDIPITGTDLTLHYSSQRTEGYQHKINFKLLGDTISAGLQEVIARLEIGGRVFEQSFTSLSTGLEAEFYWDGYDVKGSRVKGEVLGLISIGYRYQSEYSSFGNVATDPQGRDLNEFDIAWAQPGVVSTGVTAREDDYSWVYDRVVIKNTFDSQIAEGWSVSNVHEKTRDNLIYKGDGSVLESNSLSRVLKTGITQVQYQTPGEGGDDGYYQKGGSTIDYAVTTDAVLQDRVTGLEWQYTDQPEKFRFKQEAVDYCANLASNTSDPWRLPTPKELTYTIDKASGQHASPIYRFDALFHWHQNTANPDEELIPALCVRGETINDRYITELKRNATDEVVVDGQNGLMWQDDSSVASEGALYTWTEAIDHCELLDHAGYTDWRLPNINELAYTLPNNVFANATALNLPQGMVWHPGIDSSLRYRRPYWASTPNFLSSDHAWAIESLSFSYFGFDKTDQYNVRCVRDDLSLLKSPYRFDQNGRHVETVDIDSGLTLQSFNYDEDGQLTSIVDQFGNTLTVNRDIAGKVSITSHDGYETLLSIDTDNNVTRVDYDDNSYFQFSYLDESLLNWKRDRNGNDFNHYFDARGRVDQTTDPEGGLWNFYSTQLLDGSLDYGYSKAEGSNYQTVRSVLANGDIQKVTTYKDGTQSTNTRQPDNLKETIQSCGTTTVVDRILDTKTHDEIPQQITVSLPSGLTSVTTMAKTYAEGGADTTKYTLTTNTNGKASSSHYDAITGVMTITSPENRTVSYNYNPQTNLLDSLEVQGLLPSSYTYDSRGRVLTTTRGSRTQTNYYDDLIGRGQISDTEAGDGKVTSFTYDPVGRVDTVTYPDFSVVDNDYDNNGNITNVNIPSLQDYGFTFNGVNNVSIESTPALEQTQYLYDNEKNLTDIILPSAAVIHHDYVNGLIDQTTTPEGTIAYTYLCGGRVDTVTEGSESIDYDYDGDLLTTIHYGGLLGESITQGYNTDFLINSLGYAGQTTAISYDNDSILTGIHGYTITPHAQHGLPEALSNGIFVQSRLYNGYGETTSVDTQIANQGSYDYSLTYNDLGQITNKQETLHNGTVNNYVYSYHPDRRWLTSVTKNGSVVESYGYDANGNRVLHTNTARGITGVVPSYNINDQLVNDGNGATYTYTVDGYLSTKTTSEGTTTYQYSSLGRLLSVQPTAPAAAITYQHNAMGNRVAKLVGGTITEKYLWLDKTTLLAVYNADNSLKQRFEYTLGNTPTSFTQSGQKYYITSDHLGSPRTISDASGNIIKAYDYDAFGNRTIITDNNLSMDIPFGFAGGLYDKDTGLTRFGYRDYDPLLGQWTARDPIGVRGGLNTYLYVYSDPVNLIDPEGLSPKKYTKPPNPNKKPPPDHRKPSGERERNVRPAKGKGEEHSRRPKGGFLPRSPLLLIPLPPHIIESLIIEDDLFLDVPPDC